MKPNISTKEAEWAAWTGIAVNFGFACLVFWLAYLSNSESVYMEGWHLFGGIFLWLLVLLHIRQKRLALEEDMISKTASTKQETSLFQEGEEHDPFSARSQLAFFEKWIVPIGTLIIALSFIIGGSFLFYKLYSVLQGGRLAELQNAALVSTFLVGAAFFSLLLSKYSLGMSQQKEWRLLRAGGSYLFVNAVLCFLCAVSLTMTQMEFFSLERYLAVIISILIPIIGIEMVLNLILDIYRPRVADAEIHPPYDSRFLELCTGSKGILKTVAQTLDYQFGFKVSETWFYAFLEKAIAPLILFQLLSLYLLNCVVIVQPQDQAIIERFGQPLADRVLQPGFHLKWPWPIEKVYYHPVYEVHTLWLGSIHEEQDAPQYGKKRHGHSHSPVTQEEEKKEHAILFTKDHGHEEDYFLTLHTIEGSDKQEISPMNLISLDLFVDYKIRDIYKYCYVHSNPEDLLQHIATKEVTTLLLATSMEELMGNKRLEIAQTLHQSIQRLCSQKEMGIEIVQVGICNIHPPSEVANDFEAVLGATEAMKTKILEAETYRNQTIPMAEAQAKEIVFEANTYLYAQQQLPKAEAELFEKIAQAYRSGGKVYLERKYLKILEENLKNQRILVILVDNDKQVQILDLYDKPGDYWQLDLNKVEQENK